jgi:hypothetical protein
MKADGADDWSAVLQFFRERYGWGCRRFARMTLPQVYGAISSGRKGRGKGGGDGVRVHSLAEAARMMNSVQGRRALGLA